MLDLNTAVVFIDASTNEEQIGYIEERYVEGGEIAYTVEMDDGSVRECVRRSAFVLFAD